MAGVVGVLALPVATGNDDFPLSTYPMYARTRPAEVSFVTAQGATDDSTATFELSLHIIGASDDPLIVAGELRAAIRGDRADDRCAGIAQRALESGRTGYDRIEVVTERHNVVERTSGRDSLIRREVHATCPLDPS